MNGSDGELSRALWHARSRSSACPSLEVPAQTARSPASTPAIARSANGTANVRKKSDPTASTRTWVLIG